MSGESKREEEIDIEQLLDYIKRFFIYILKLVVSVVLFYRKKWVMFFVLLIIVISGYVLNQFSSEKTYLLLSVYC